MISNSSTRYLKYFDVSIVDCTINKGTIPIKIRIIQSNHDDAADDTLLLFTVVLLDIYYSIRLSHISISRSAIVA